MIHIVYRVNPINLFFLRSVGAQYVLTPFD